MNEIEDLNKKALLKNDENILNLLNDWKLGRKSCRREWNGWRRM